jgi:hypothetical protein
VNSFIVRKKNNNCDQKCKSISSKQIATDATNFAAKYVAPLDQEEHNNRAEIRYVIPQQRQRKQKIVVFTSKPIPIHLSFWSSDNNLDFNSSKYTLLILNSDQKEEKIQ